MDFVEVMLGDQRRHGHDGVFRLCFALFGTGLKTVEAMFADVGGAGQDGVDLRQAPAPAIQRTNAAFIEKARDRLHAHRAAAIGAFNRKSEDQPYRPDVERIDLQRLLDFRTPLFDRHRAIADRRPGAVPVALPGILAHGA